jgi:hypothetical protein
MIISRIKFYADSAPGIKNKLFCYSCDELHFQEFFSRQFAAGLSIRAAWFEKIEMPSKNVLENIRFKPSDINTFFDYFTASLREKKNIDAIRSKAATDSFIQAAIKESQALSSSINNILNYSV